MVYLSLPVEHRDFLLPSFARTVAISALWRSEEPNQEALRLCGQKTRSHGEYRILLPRGALFQMCADGALDETVRAWPMLESNTDWYAVFRPIGELLTESARCSLRSMRTRSQRKTPSNCHSLSTWMTSWIPSWVAKRQWLLWEDTTRSDKQTRVAESRIKQEWCQLLFWIGLL